MFEFAFEGALLAFIVNGDRFELLALLPRRKPRTDRTVQPPCLNLTSSRLLRFACPLWRLAWISVSSGLGRPSTLIGRKAAGCQRILLFWLWGLMAIPISCQTSLPRNTIGDMRQRMMRHEVRYESGVDYSYSPANCIFSTRGPMSRRESEGESTRWLRIMTLSNMTPRITFEGVFFCSHPYIRI